MAQDYTSGIEGLFNNYTKQTNGTEKGFFGAKPDIVSDKSQLPTTRLDNLPKDEPGTTEKNTKILQKEESPKQAPKISSERPIINTLTDDQDYISKVFNANLSKYCNIMCYKIHEIQKYSKSEWVEITRLDFESMGINPDYIAKARSEGVDKKMFEIKPIEEVTKTGKIIVRGYLYRLNLK